MGVAQAEQVPVNIVGGSTFGLYPKISFEKTYNMYISDNWLVNYAGFKKLINILPAGEGRGFYKCVIGNFLITVVSSTVYRLNSNLSPIPIGNLDTSSGEAFIDENLSNQICIVDGDSAYIYNYVTNTFTKQTLTFLGNPVVPNYVCYHNTFFLIGSAPTSDNPHNWYAYSMDTDDTIILTTQLSLQTKPDAALAVERLPGRGNNVLVLGSTVAEIWTQVGGTENYRRVQSFNINNGVVNVATIAGSDEYICWLAQNENNSPSIMMTDGGSTKRLSTDGIDDVLSKITHPQDSTAFFYQQAGHLFYQLTFFHPDDNLTLFYDFNTQLFFHASDERMDFHPARQVVYFNKKTYFVSLDDAGIYEMDGEFLTYNYSVDKNSVGDEIPRLRICKTIRKEDSSTFRIGQFTFWLEQGVNDYFIVNDGETCNGLMITQEGGYILTQEGGRMLTQEGSCFVNPNRPRVDMSFSKNGNQSFSNIVSRELNPAGDFKNQIRWHRMGQANEFTVQLRFWGFQRFVAFNGIVEIY